MKLIQKWANTSDLRQSKAIAKGNSEKQPGN